MHICNSMNTYFRPVRFYACLEIYTSNPFVFLSLTCILAITLLFFPFIFVMQCGSLIFAKDNLDNQPIN